MNVNNSQNGAGSRLCSLWSPRQTGGGGMAVRLRDTKSLDGLTQKCENKEEPASCVNAPFRFLGVWLRIACGAARPFAEALRTPALQAQESSHKPGSFLQLGEEVTHFLHHLVTQGDASRLSLFEPNGVELWAFSKHCKPNPSSYVI